MIINRFKEIGGEYPRNFWVVIGALFIDRLGGALIFPFIALFVTAKFEVGLTEVGQIFAIVSVGSILGSVAGGAMADRFGRKSTIILGLILSALSALLFGLAQDLQVIYMSGVIIGLFFNLGGPAQQAIISDLLPEEKRVDGFGLLRIASNLAVTIGPAIGGVLAAQSYLWLFFTDAIASTITALIVLFMVPETKPEKAVGQTGESLIQTLSGYSEVIHDGLFMAFIMTSMLIVSVYMQMNTTLSVYLRDIHSVSNQGYGYLLSLNAGMVVLFQFWITRRIKHLPPMATMIVGALLYAVGFSMYGFVSAYFLFMLAMAIITIGEMFIAPVGQTLAADFAPQDMRGRYLAMYGFTWTIPSTFSPWVAGLVFDNLNPDWVWYGCGILSMITIAGYLFLHIPLQERFADRKS